jgi:hypothetical protein
VYGTSSFGTDAVLAVKYVVEYVKIVPVPGKVLYSQSSERQFQQTGVGGMRMVPQATQAWHTSSCFAAASQNGFDHWSGCR